MIAVLSRMLREEHAEKVIYESKPEGVERNLPWLYFKDEDSRKENSNLECPEVRECLTNSRHIKEAIVT